MNHLKGKKVFAAKAGKSGSGKNMKGESGEKLLIPVPNGTIIHALETGELIGEISIDSTEIVIAKGGKGGVGNARFKSSTNQSPRKITKSFKSGLNKSMLFKKPIDLAFNSLKRLR